MLAIKAANTSKFLLNPSVADTHGDKSAKPGHPQRNLIFFIRPLGRSLPKNPHVSERPGSRPALAGRGLPHYAWHSCRADAAEVIPGVNAGFVAVAPTDADGVVAHLFGAQHLQYRFEHLQGIGGFGLARRGAMRAGAAGAGTLVAQVDQPVFAVMAILPVDLDAAGLEMAMCSGSLEGLMFD